jgi:hypothetical protein
VRVLITATHDGYPAGRKVTFAADTTPDVPDAYGEILIANGLATRPPASTTPTPTIEPAAPAREEDEDAHGPA